MHINILIAFLVCIVLVVAYQTGKYIERRRHKLHL